MYFRTCTGLALALLALCIGATKCIGAAAEMAQSRPSWADEETVALMFNRKISSILSTMDNCYVMSPRQREAIVCRLEELKPRQIRITIETAEEREQLSRRLSEILAPLRNTKDLYSVLPDEYWEMRTRLRDINDMGPLRNTEKALAEAEKFLPEEQARAGREAYHEMIRQTDIVAECFGRYGESLARLIAPGDLWWNYVERFCLEFALEPPQKVTANSIIREIVARRDVYVSKHPLDMEKARSAAPIPDEFRNGIEALWAELRERLDVIPTKSQIEAVKKRFPAARSTTRPSDYISRRWVRTTSRPSPPLGADLHSAPAP